MVGEIRDTETAEISVQAALTGHLVFSTLHTNDAPGALIRLNNMGVEPFLITSAVIGVVGQRLLRKICGGCAEPEEPDPGLLYSLGITEDQVARDVQAGPRLPEVRRPRLQGPGGGLRSDADVRPDARRRARPTRAARR